MKGQLINPLTGAFRLSDSFAITTAAQPDDLMRFFGKDALQESIYQKGCWYTLQKREIAGLYFKFCFYFTSARRLKNLRFEVDESQAEREPWASNHLFETQWIAGQVGDTSNFVWDLTQAGRQYHLSFDWGTIGVYYDFKNGTFESLLSYRSE